MFIPELAVGLYRIVEVSSRRYVEQTFWKKCYLDGKN
jgi:hypothetical protein